jgi:hypothetical protein
MDSEFSLQHSHVPASCPYTEHQSISPCPRLSMGTFRKKIRFYGEKLLARCPNPKLEDHPVSGVRGCLFNIFVATLHIGEAVPPSAPWGRAMPWWQGATDNGVGLMCSRIIYPFQSSTTEILGPRGGVVVKTLRYKPAGSGFDSRWCHWNFSVT